MAKSPKIRPEPLDELLSGGPQEMFGMAIRVLVGWTSK